ncbi:MAG: hypothetical protein RL660_2899 [Bacteroidota bacterium]|jgi:hypothetical protein
MRNKNRIILTLALAAMVGATGCKKFLNVNENPNTLPEDKAKMELALPSAEYTIAYVLGNTYQEVGGFLSQYWTQRPSATQYYDFERYSFDANDLDREWGQLYAGALRDLEFIDQQAVSTKDSNFGAVAKLLKAYTYQLVSDVHGDVPMSEAMKGDDNILNPRYDSQEQVYEQVIKLIDDAIVLLGNGQTSTIGSADVIFGGDMALWAKFANSLKLKALMRIAEKDASAIAKIGAMATADFFLPGDVASAHTNENAVVGFFDKIGSKNPLYASIQGLGTNNNVASKTIGDTLNALGDPRASYFYDLNTAGLIVGTPQGAAAAGIGYPTNAPVSEVSESIINSTKPVYLISAYEVYFLLAEAQARNWMTGNAQESYEAAVVGSMAECNLDTTGLDLFGAAPYAWAATLPDQLSQIGFQKWVAFCGTQNMESWIEQRRMDVLNLAPSTASTLPGTAMPMRIPYAASEETANSNFPGQKLITDKMWWDL